MLVGLSDRMCRLLAFNYLFDHGFERVLVTGRELGDSVVLLVENGNKYLLVADAGKFECLLEEAASSLRQRDAPLQEVLNDVEIFRRLDGFSIL